MRVEPYYYELAPWTWYEAERFQPPRWGQPSSVVGAIDLRTLSAQAISGGPPEGLAFVASLQPLGGTEIATSLHIAEENVTSRMQDAWQSETGYRPQGAKLVDLLWDQLTTGSDPSGESGPKPLMPGVDLMLRLHVPGHSLVKSERFHFGSHAHTSRVRDLLRKDFERQWEQTGGDDQCRRCLDFTCKKYQVDNWREFVPTRLHSHVPGRLPHATTITESFTGFSGFGFDQSWTQVAGTWTNFINDAMKSATGDTQEHARCDATLSSDDHYAQSQDNSDTVNHFIGPIFRCINSSTHTYYLAVRNSSAVQLYKNVAGSLTQIDSTSITAAGLDVWKGQADGSTIKSFLNSVEKGSVTDTAITGNVHCGIHAFQSGGTSRQDNFEAGDLAAPPAGGNPKLLGGKLLHSPLLHSKLLA